MLTSIFLQDSPSEDEDGPEHDDNWDIDDEEEEAELDDEERDDWVDYEDEPFHRGKDDAFEETSTTPMSRDVGSCSVPLVCSGYERS